jgi:hypothetical protein
VPNANFDSILSTTLKNYLPSLVDNIFSARPLAYWLKSKDRIRLISGGATIVVPIIYSLNTTAGSYSGYDTLSIVPQDGITSAEYNWAQFGATVAIAGIEEAKNNGEASIIDLLEGKIQQAEETIVEKMDSMFFGDGTGNSGKDWLGLSALINSTGVVGGIDGSTDVFWRSATDAAGEAITLRKLTTVYNSASVGNDHPDVILTTQSLYEGYEALLQPQLRYQDTKTADGGFQNLLFKTAPMMYDNYQTAGRVDMLNSKYLKLVGHQDKWFTTSPFVTPEDQDARYAKIICYGQLTLSNRSRHGFLTNKT